MALNPLRSCLLNSINNMYAEFRPGPPEPPSLLETAAPDLPGIVERSEGIDGFRCLCEGPVGQLQGIQSQTRISTRLS
jgi:hypothetical protein